MLGLLAVFLASLPRYLAGGHETRLSLILMMAAVVTAVVIVHWRLLSSEGKRRTPGLLKRLGLSLLAGLAAMSLWHALFSAWVGWEIALSHGATLGLLLHVMVLWWRREPE
ncbi:hypothetical protein HIO72_16420 [Halomonas sp. PA5]|nr:hypothetical protein [Halomonas populi]QJQ97213.1 hypothetical protein HIO72_16420 [Halomonas sp. PA5]